MNSGAVGLGLSVQQKVQRVEEAHLSVSSCMTSPGEREKQRQKILILRRKFFSTPKIYFESFI